jgi:hypothetical protein
MPQIRGTRVRRIKFNLMVSADCVPTSVTLTAINRHLDRVKPWVGETVRCMLKENCPYW